MSKWCDKFMAKHSKEMHRDVLDRVNPCCSPQANIERFKREVERSDAKTTELRNKMSENLDGLKRAIELARMETGAFWLTSDHPIVTKHGELEREIRDSDLIASETCQLIAWLEDEVRQCGFA